MTIDTATFLAQLGNHSDQQTGAISPPIYLSTTFAHPEILNKKAIHQSERNQLWWIALIV